MTEHDCQHREALLDLAIEMNQWVHEACYGEQTKYRLDMACDVSQWCARLNTILAGGSDELPG